MIGEEEPLITVVSSGRADFSVGDIQSGRSSKSASAGIPNRFSMLNLSWVFLFASITLTAGFIMLHTTLITNAGLVNATFSISSIAWLVYIYIYIFCYFLLFFIIFFELTFRHNSTDLVY